MMIDKKGEFNMRMGKLVSFLLCLLMLCAFGTTAFADDPSPTGSLSVRVLETGTGNGIPNAKVEIYLVAGVEDFEHVLTAPFAASGFSLSSLEDMSATANKQAAGALVTYATTNHISCTADGTTSAAGSVSFTGLQQGLYLVRESVSPAGHTPISPFLITIPQYLNDEPIYDVDATPKADTSNVAPTPTPTPTPPPGGNLPQTGQLWWPVAVMAVLGLGFVVLGIVIKRREHNA